MGYLPGDRKDNESLEQVIRVNHAGELAAKQIYLGQLAILKSKADQALLQNMLAEEEAHLNYFAEQIKLRKVRPSILLPLWSLCGYILGASTALLGKTSAMLCTEAVEEVIDQHYQAQLKTKIIPTDIANNIEKFRQEELDHLDIAKANRAELHLGHRLLHQIIKTGCKISIELAKRF